MRGDPVGRDLEQRSHVAGWDEDGVSVIVEHARRVDRSVAHECAQGPLGLAGQPQHGVEGRGSAIRVRAAAVESALRTAGRRSELVVESLDEQSAEGDDAQHADHDGDREQEGEDAEHEPAPEGHVRVIPPL